MAIISALMATMLFVVLHVSPVRGVTMAARDKTALIAMREAIENKNVFPAIRCSSYFDCDTSGRVVLIALTGLGLKGRISTEIGKLTKLTFLFMYGNKLSGSIPWSIIYLKSLTTMILWDNQLSGSIPWSIGNLTSLTEINLSYNQLSGSIPWSIGNLAALRRIDLRSNKLSGNIPSSIGNLKFLLMIDLGNNTLTGIFPPSITEIETLFDFYVDNNYMTGPIPSNNRVMGCFQLRGNCLYGANAAFGCAPSEQRSKTTCASFCNALQKGGACGGHGICSIGKDGKTSTCACNKGYNNKASKYTCK